MKYLHVTKQNIKKQNNYILPSKGRTVEINSGDCYEEFMVTKGYVYLFLDCAEGRMLANHLMNEIKGSKIYKVELETVEMDFDQLTIPGGPYEGYAVEELQKIKNLEEEYEYWTDGIFWRVRGSIKVI